MRVAAVGQEAEAKTAGACSDEKAMSSFANVLKVRY